MHSPPDDGSSNDRRRKHDSPRHQLAENHSNEIDGTDTFNGWDWKADRWTGRQMGFLTYGTMAVMLAGVLLLLERDLVPVPESALSWVTIVGAAAMLLIALIRYTRVRRHHSAE